jgi:hypothetical protein
MLGGEILRGEKEDSQQSRQGCSTQVGEKRMMLDGGWRAAGRKTTWTDRCFRAPAPTTSTPITFDRQ